MLKLKRLLATLTLCFMCLSTSGVTVAALATDTAPTYPFDNNSVETDLADVDLSLYKVAEDTTLIMLVERDFETENAALYAYVYNATGASFSEDSNSNVINMAESYDENGEPTSYCNFKLKYCDKSDDLTLYKFRVLDENNVLYNNAVYSNEVRGERRYDVAGIQLIFQYANLALDYPVAKTYIYSGDLENSTLTVKELTTVELEVHPIWYRTESSSAGAGHQNQLNGVYFSVDNTVLENYGPICKIKAEWYEYKTEPIVVLEDWFEEFKQFIGVDISQPDIEKPAYTLWSVRTTVAGEYGFPSHCYYNWAYNLPADNDDMCFHRYDGINKLTYLFDTEGKQAEEYVLKTKRLTDYIYSYTSSADKGYLDIKNGTISADLFQDAVDEGRSRGYNKAEISTEDSFSLLSYKDTHKWWETFLMFGFKQPTDSSITNIEPIVKVNVEDIKSDYDNVGDSLLIDKGLVYDFVDDVKSASEGDKTTYIFRFANTDYYNFYLDRDASSVREDYHGYVATETVFLDFDIIELTCRNDVGSTVIPVVASPIDHIASITPPVQYGLVWWVYCLIVGVVAIVGLVLSIKYGRFLR